MVMVGLHMAEVGVYRHQSVLSQEVVTGLAPVSGGRYVDATFGGGGHTVAILEASAPAGLVVAMDRDGEAVQQGLALGQRYPGRLQVFQSPFSDMKTLLSQEGIDQVEGVLFDLGVSSWQLDAPQRGFSFLRDGPLDMRMDQGQEITAATLVNRLSERELSDIIYQYGEDRQSRRLARGIVLQRQEAPFTTTGQLAALAAKVLPRWAPIHPATRLFQALRIVVNEELAELEMALQSAFHALAPGGRLAVIAFHSLEDRIVKHYFQRLANPRPLPGSDPRTPDPPPLLHILTRKPLVAGEAEVAENPRARSAKLRIAQRTATPTLGHPALVGLTNPEQGNRMRRLLP